MPDKFSESWLLKTGVSCHLTCMLAQEEPVRRPGSSAQRMQLTAGADRAPEARQPLAEMNRQLDRCGTLAGAGEHRSLPATEQAACKLASVDDHK